MKSSFATTCRDGRGEGIKFTVWARFEPLLQGECRSVSYRRTASAALQRSSNVDLLGDARRIFKFDAKELEWISDAFVTANASKPSNL